MAIEDKAERRIQILRAADGLLDLQRQALPSVADIARAAGVAKGTPYLYFKTKEEIYLALLAEGFAVWMDVICTALRSERVSVDMILGRYVRFCAKNPRIMFLASMAPTILERNISVETAYAFKKRLADQTIEIGGLLSRAFPGLPPEAAGRLFMHTYAITTGLWQHSNPPPVVEEAYKREDISTMKLDFQTELHAALQALWRGTLENRRQMP